MCRDISLFFVSRQERVVPTSRFGHPLRGVAVSRRGGPFGARQTRPFGVWPRRSCDSAELAERPAYSSLSRKRQGDGIVKRLANSFRELAERPRAGRTVSPRPA